MAKLHIQDLIEILAFLISVLKAWAEKETDVYVLIPRSFLQRVKFLINDAVHIVGVGEADALVLDYILELTKAEDEHGNP